MDCIYKVGQTFGKISRGIFLQLQHLLDNKPKKMQQAQDPHFIQLLLWHSYIQQTSVLSPRKYISISISNLVPLPNKLAFIEISDLVLSPSKMTEVDFGRYNIYNMYNNYMLVST